MTGRAFQDDPFGSARWLERTTPSGGEVRVVFEPGRTCFEVSLPTATGP